METSASYETLGFTDLLDIYTTKCSEVGQEPDESFKTKEALIDAIAKLSAPPQANGEDKPSGEAGDLSKYNSSERRGPNQGIGAFAKDQLMLGKSNQEVLDEINKQFPTAKTTISCVAYYRNVLKNGRPVKGGQARTGGNPEAMRKQAADLLRKAEAIEKAQAESVTKENIEAKVREEIEARIREEVEARYAALLKEQAEKTEPVGEADAFVPAGDPGAFVSPPTTERPAPAV